MRHSALYFANIADEQLADRQIDAVFCTDFLNVAEFRGLASNRLRQLPLVLYFHENQFAYPVREDEPRDLHFAFTNFVSAVAADQVWFNSQFNRDSFLGSVREACRRWPDYSPLAAVDRLPHKCVIESPGVDLSDLPNAPPPRAGKFPIRLVWAARWEHDKNPGLLLDALRALRRREVDFRISIVGETFQEIPPEFGTIREEFSPQIDNWGFQPTREAYWQVLQAAEVFVSTADHEFFGIAAAEAIAVGNWPLLPDRLAYPELVSAEIDSRNQSLFLYDGTPDQLAEKIEYLSANISAEQNVRHLAELQSELSNRLDWRVRAASMDDRMESGSGDPTPRDEINLASVADRNDNS